MVIQHKFDPYADNGGTSLAIAGEDFCVVAADTRQSDGYSINSRTMPKAFKVSNSTVIATAGFYADAVRLAEVLALDMETYRNDHGKEMRTPALAQKLSETLYKKRFFPYYVFNIVGGLDAQGKGAVFSYDPVGSYEREVYKCGGSASHLIQSFLDNQLGLKHQPNKPKVLPTLETALRVAKDAFTGAAERDIYTVAKNKHINIPLMLESNHLYSVNHIDAADACALLLSDTVIDMATKVSTASVKNPIHEDTRRRQEIATENACAERWEAKWGFMKNLYESPAPKPITSLSNNSTSILPVKDNGTSLSKNAVPADKFYIPATESHQIGWAWTGIKLEKFGRGDGHHITPEQVRQAFGNELLDFKV